MNVKADVPVRRIVVPTICDISTPAELMHEFDLVQ